MYFTVDQYFEKMRAMGHEPSQEIQDNAAAFLPKVNLFLVYLFENKILPEGYEIILNSGWRTPEYNVAIGGAPHSNHCTGHAIDIHGQDIIKLCTNDWYKRESGLVPTSLLEMFGLYAESENCTPSWTHLQDVTPASGRRIFLA